MSKYLISLTFEQHQKSVLLQLAQHSTLLPYDVLHQNFACQRSETDSIRTAAQNIYQGTRASHYCADGLSNIRNAPLRLFLLWARPFRSQKHRKELVDS